MTDGRAGLPEDAAPRDEPPDPTTTGDASGRTTTTEDTPTHTDDAPGDTTKEAPPAVPTRRRFTAAASRDLWRGALVLVAVATVTGAVVRWALPDDQRVEVVETGFTADLPSDGMDDATYGVVVENPTNEVAYHTVVCVELRLADADAGADADGGCEEFTIEVMFPGQRLGIGAVTDVLGEQVTGIDVHVRGPAAWEDPDDHSHPADADTDVPVPHVIEAGDVAVTYSPDHEPVVSFVPVSRYIDDVRRASAYAIFRDTDGRIIGGSGTDLPSPIRPQDDTRRSIVVDDTELPDLATAEVYVFPSGL
jgi:hypothetical protein